MYIIKFWPLLKFKSLFSECIEYKEFPMKISTAYLAQSKKEPLFGTINYGKHFNAVLREEHARSKSDVDATCEVGRIKCVLSQECVKGNL